MPKLLSSSAAGLASNSMLLHLNCNDDKQVAIMIFIQYLQGRN